MKNTETTTANKTKVHGVHMPHALWAAVRIEALRQERTANWIVVKAVTLYLANCGKAVKP
jgi:hypothetical protein